MASLLLVVFIVFYPVCLFGSGLATPGPALPLGYWHPDDHLRPDPGDLRFKGDRTETIGRRADGLSIHSNGRAEGGQTPGDYHVWLAFRLLLQYLAARLLNHDPFDGFFLSQDTIQREMDDIHYLDCDGLVIFLFPIC